MEYRIEQAEEISNADLRLVEEGIREAARVDWQKKAYEPLGFLVRSESDVLIGAVIGNTGGPWLYISALWVEKSSRKKGLGGKLMDAAETEAARRGCTGAYLDSFSDDAVRFYCGRGYECFGRLDAGPGESVRRFLWRRLDRGTLLKTDQEDA